jgi:2'-5' RNA ligase
MRLFVAADLPAPLREELAAAAPPRPWRALRPEMLHVTLAFLGELPEDDVAVITAGLVPEVEVPVCAIGETLFLPPRRPRVCAVRLGDEGGRLKALREGVVSALEALELYERETRRFLPHVTLARARPGETRSRDFHVPVQGTFTVPAMSLYASHPGSRYEQLHRWALA